ncbi:hypothetical protein BH24ACT26_BH24ACT26_17920 [soil metagenome]
MGTRSNGGSVVGAGPALLWAKAPLVLRRFPGVLVAVIAATAVLGLASAAAPLFFSSAANRAVHERIVDVSRWQAGLTVQQAGAFFGHDSDGRTVWDAFRARDEALRKETGPVAGLGPRVLTIIGSPGTLERADHVGPVMNGRLATRTGALDHIERLAQVRDGEVHVAPQASGALRHCVGRRTQVAPGSGVWLADSVALQLEACPGESVEIGLQGGSARVPIEGVYRNLVTVYPAKFWLPVSEEFLGEGAPAFVLADRSLFARLGDRLEDGGVFRWEFPVEGSGLTLPAAKTLEGRLRTIMARLHDPGTRLGRLYESSAAESLLLNIARTTEKMVSATRGPVDLLAVGGRLLALAITAAAGVYGIQRRRVELNLLLTRGMGPWALGSRASVEALLPAAVGGAIGWTACLVVTKLLGPSSSIDAVALGAAGRDVALTVAVGVALLGMVTGVGLRGAPVAQLARARGALAAVPWDVGLLVLAALSWRELERRGGLVAGVKGGAPRVDVVVLVFPVLFIAGATGLATRALRSLLPKLRVGGGGLSPPLFFAFRRLAAASRIALLLVTLAALSVGVFVYAGTLAASGRATVTAKALTFIGSDVAVPLPPNPTIPERLGFPSTVVTKLDGVRVLPNLMSVDVLGVDPTTFSTAAFWDDSFAPQSFEGLLTQIDWDGGRAVPAIVAGSSVDDGSVLEASGASAPLDVTATVRSWPGMFSQRPLVIVDRRALEPSPTDGDGSHLGATGARELWVKGEPAEVLDALAAQGLALQGTLTLSEVRDAASLLPLEWTFGFLQSLGAAAGVLALVGMLLYLQARQRSRVVANALVRRMGLTGPAHARAIGLELTSMLMISFALGASLAALAADLVYGRLDPLPEVAPAPLLRVPIALIALIGLLLVVAASLGAWRVQRSADRTNVAEVMRVAG